MWKSLGSDTGLLVVSLVLSAAVFAADAMIPLGVTGGVLYVPVVLTGLWISWRPAIFILAVLGTLLTIAGFYISPMGGEVWQVWTNRGLALATIWVAALLIHYRRRREDFLVHRERALGTANMETAGAVVIVLDPDGRLVHCNRACEEIAGRSQDQLAGMPVWELVGQADGSAGLEAAFAALKTDRMPSRCETFLAAPEGGQRRISWSNTPHFGAAGAIDYVILAGVDITEQYAAGERLRESEERHRQLTDISPDAIIVQCEGRIVFANPAAVRLFGGKTRDDLIGREALDLVHPGDRARIVERRSEVLQGKSGATELGTITQLRLDRSEFLGDGLGAPLRWDRKDAVLFVIRDVTALRSAEDELRNAKEGAEHANATKTRFLAAASHDLRQPLYAMSLFLTTLMERLSDPAYADLLKNLEQSLESANRLLETVLDISTLDAGVVTTELDDFPIQSILDRIAAEFAPLSDVADNALTVVPCSAFVRSDRALLENILRNLVSNAVRYTRGGRILVGCRRRADAIRFVVRDTGPGIPPEKHADIFNEFERLAVAPSSDNAGLGLGLAIVDRTAKLLGYTVEVDSSVGKGSTFSFEVPRGKTVQQSAPLAPDAGAAASPYLRDATVALIENDPGILLAVPEFLSRWGCNCVAGVSARHAILNLEGAGRVPDLVLADYHLSEGQTGLDAVQALRSKWGRDIPAVIVTADTSPEIARRAREQGVPLLTKPVQPAKLRALLLHLLHAQAEMETAAAARR